MEDSIDCNKPLGIILEGTLYNVGNIASFTDTTNEVTKRKYISVTFIRPIDGKNGVNVPFKDEYWNSLHDSFDRVKVYC